MKIKYINAVFPENMVDNAQIDYLPDKWSPEKIEKKLGIRTRAIAAADETSADLATRAARQLMEKHQISPESIDFLFFCTQSPDYFLPTSACMIQNNLGLPTTCGAVDFNLGCSGYIYGLAMARGMIDSGLIKKAIFVTGETYSKFIYEKDWSVRTIFGDAATASLLTSDNDTFGDDRQGILKSMNGNIGNFNLGTDGAGWENLIVPYGGMRQPTGSNEEIESDNGSIRRAGDLYMHGSKIFNFTLDTVPIAVEDVLVKNSMDLADVDLFIFHQANKHMLSALMKKCEIPSEKFYVNMVEYGNTVSNTIPIALQEVWEKGIVKKGDRIMLVGFGVGYSWGATIVTLD
ncbi:MAG: 3-oxoacyl-ACP synthase [Candidatus Wallbacteria bacterium HGW-Wallbacteria-1]|uniref:3-oxoacyl-ACP synthase n=1 Tax=Candidatus Wallbacteria bacterium HGW-Wallbacteria-1 TaxID=2013854 RepID=A0A2N1PJD7_9BACT|nr:MAG: 3-oxoacyl-ACP synthase [Candidatus Wallbacteria bacterium HGW-Wallbacteria-1]